MGKATKAKSKLPAYTISREKGRVKGFYHVQARTGDQFSSFATLAPENANILRAKSADGTADVFTLSFTIPDSPFHVTMNVLGIIKYEGEWA